MNLPPRTWFKEYPYSARA